MKKIVVLLLVLMMVVAACAQPASSPAPAPAPAPAAPEAPAAPAPAPDAPVTTGEVVYAIVTKSAGNPFMERMASGFVAAGEAMGVSTIVQHPEDTTAEAQIVVINNLIAQGVKGIAIAANDPNALESTIQSARDQGIYVITLDSDTAGSAMFVNQAGVFEVAQVLVDSVYDMTGGAGMFAVLSATSTATNQNAWIAAMAEIIAGDPKYAELDWITTVYGDDEAQKSFDEAQSLLVNIPNLNVIVAPTTVGILAAAQVVMQQNSDVLVAGLGLPSEMLGVTGEGLPCPYMYLWNPIELGEVAGYALGAFVNGDTTGAVGESFSAPNGKTYEVIAAAPEVGIVNNQIIVGLPFRFDGDNIAEWAQVY